MKTNIKFKNQNYIFDLRNNNFLKKRIFNYLCISENDYILIGRSNTYEILPKIKGGNALAGGAAVIVGSKVLSNLQKQMGNSKDATDAYTEIREKLDYSHLNQIDKMCTTTQDAKNVINVKGSTGCVIKGIKQVNIVKNMCEMSGIIKTVSRLPDISENTVKTLNGSIGGSFASNKSTNKVRKYLSTHIQDFQINHIQKKCATDQSGILNKVDIKNCDNSAIENIVQSNKAYNSCINKGVINVATDISTGDKVQKTLKEYKEKVDPTFDQDKFMNGDLDSDNPYIQMLNEKKKVGSLMKTYEVFNFKVKGVILLIAGIFCCVFITTIIYSMVFGKDPKKKLVYRKK